MKQIVSPAIQDERKPETYDPVGNRLSSLGVSPYNVNTSNELTSTPSTTYTYDSNGNTLTKVVGSNTTTYAWDYENRLSSVTLPGSGGTVSFAYGPVGRRVKKVTSTTTSIFAYDGDNLIEETNSSGAAVARYEQTQNIDEPLAMLRSSTTSFYQADGLGSITSLSNGAGALAQTYTFDSFGKLTASSGSLTNPFQYTARESDSETGLYYYHARYYDQSPGRFLSEDPIGFKGGPNFYEYGFNSPIISRDPTGLFPTPWHRNVTSGLARAVFGGKCADKAKAVGDADAAVDSFGHGAGGGVVGTVKGFFQFMTNTGEPWAQPGPHFPSQAMLDQLHARALSTCSLKDLGEDLHSRQDAYAHSGWSSFDHYTHSFLSLGFAGPDVDATKDMGLADAAMLDTVRELSQFKSKCLTCCQ